MANKTYGKFLFGLSDIKITNLAGSTQEDLDAGMEMVFRPRFRASTLEGDDADKAVISFVTGGEASVSAGSISSGALAIITGQSPTVSGSSPNEVTTHKISAGARMPYFKIYAKVNDESTGDAHLLLYKVKLVGGLEISIKDGEWVTPGFDLQAVDDGTNGVFKLVQNETAAAVPAT